MFGAWAKSIIGFRTHSGGDERMICRSSSLAIGKRTWCGGEILKLLGTQQTSRSAQTEFCGFLWLDVRSALLCRADVSTAQCWCVRVCG